MLSDRAIKEAVLRRSRRHLIGISEVLPLCRGREHAVRLLDELVQSGALTLDPGGGFRRSSLQDKGPAPALPKPAMPEPEDVR